MEDHPLTLPQPVENYNQQGLPGQVCFPLTILPIV